VETRTSPKDKRGGRVMAAYLPANLVALVEARARIEERSNSQVIRRALRESMSDEQSDADEFDDQGLAA
jgi:hypothetical protein